PLPRRRSHGARGVRHVRDHLHRAPRPDTDPDARGLGGPSPAQGLRRRPRPGAVQTRAGAPMSGPDTSSPFVRETFEGAQELASRHDTSPDELGREVGSVLRLPESYGGVDVSDIDIERPDDETMIINMGPQHPSTHGVLRLMMELDGETILRTKPIIGYLHTGMEKTAEQLTYQQGSTNVTRMDYLSPLNNELVFSLATEKLLGIELPPRAVWIRMLLTELQRMSSHLMWLATNGIDLGSTTLKI